jgi:hypothetical protein
MNELALFGRPAVSIRKEVLTFLRAASKRLFALQERDQSETVY